MGNATGLFVANQTESGFTVQGTSAARDGAFNYRIVARRKDLPPGRMEKVSAPKTPDRAPAAKALDAKGFPVRPPSPDLTAAPTSRPPATTKASDGARTDGGDWFPVVFRSIVVGSRRLAGSHARGSSHRHISRQV